MADPKDPLSVLNTDPKKLELIRKFFKEYTGDVSGLSKELQAVGRELGFIAEKTKEATIAEKELRNMYRNRAVIAGEFNKILSSNKQIRDEELKIEQAALVHAEQAYAKTIERLGLIDEEILNKKELLRENRKEYTLQKEILLQKKNEGIITEAQFRSEKKKLDKKAAQRNLYLKSLNKERDKLVQIARVEKQRAADQSDEVEKQEKLNKGFDTSIGFLDGMIEKTGFFSEKWTTGPLGGIQDFLEAGGDLGDLFDELSLKLGKINLKNLAANVLTTIFEQTLMFLKQFDKLAADFRKNTGIIDRNFGGIEQRIVNVQRANLRMGVSMDEAFQAANALTAEMASFTSMTDDAQKTVLSAATILQEFGVGAQTTAQIFNNFSKGLGYNANQLEKLSTQLMGISTSLKIPPQIIATEFNAASKELMKYGNNMVGVFEGIAEQSKQTGIAMGELLGIVKQFDTFEGAGDAVGKLNAILGGPYLNAINMLYATEDERIKQLRESIQLSGRQFSQLSRFEQQAIATAAGISDMTVAARLFGGTNSEFANTQMSMKEMQDRAQKAQAVTEKFTQVMQSFAIALGPVVHVLGLLADVLLFVINPFGELARLFGADEGLISYMGSFTVAGYAVAVMIMKGWIPALAGLNVGIIKLKMTTFQLVGALMGAVAIGTFMYDWVSGMSTAVAILTTVLVVGALAWAAYLTAASGGLAAIPIALGLAAVGAAVGGIAGTIETFSTGKRPGQAVGADAALVGEKGEEMVVTEDGSRYMVNSPSVMALDTQDTVYSNAETKAMMNGGGNNNNTEQLALMRQQQTEFMQSMREERAMLQRSITELANRPNRIELDGKAVYKGQKEYMLKDPNLRIV